MSFILFDTMCHSDTDSVTRCVMSRVKGKGHLFYLFFFFFSVCVTRTVTCQAATAVGSFNLPNYPGVQIDRKRERENRKKDWKEKKTRKSRGWFCFSSVVLTDFRHTRRVLMLILALRQALRLLPCAIIGSSFTKSLESIGLWLRRGLLFTSWED